jgi:hypothetical protein
MHNGSNEPTLSARNRGIGGNEELRLDMAQCGGDAKTLCPNVLEPIEHSLCNSDSTSAERVGKASDLVIL